MNKDLVSVVMTVFNKEKFIYDSIMSILKQTYTNIELIIVNDKSTDNSEAIIKDVMCKDDRIILINNSENLGAAVSRNIGISKATGKYIALIDADDLWKRNKIEKQIFLIKRNDADLVYCSYEMIDSCGNIIGKPFIVPEKTNFEDMLFSSVISCSTAFAKADLLKNNPFDTTYYHEDYDLWMRLLSQNISACGDKEIFAYYRQVNESRSYNKFRSAKERWIVYRKSLNISFLKSLLIMARYSINGIKKYYGTK